MKKLVTTRQLILVLILGIVGLKVLFFPSLFIRTLSRDSYLYILFMLLLDFLLLLTFIYLKNKFKEMSFYEILETLFGKVIAKLIMFAFFAYFFNKSTIIFETNYIYLSENLYTTFNWLSFSLPMVIVIFLISLNGINAFARTCEIIVPIILFAFIISITIGSIQADLTNLLPFMENGVSLDVFKFTFWFGDFLVFIPFFGNVKHEKHTDMWILICVLATILLVCLMFFVFYAKFSYGSTSHSNAISDLIQASPSISDIGSFEWIIILIWDMALFLFMTLNLFGAVYCFRHAIFKVNQNIVITVIIVAIFVINYLGHFDIFYTVSFILDYQKFPCIAVQYGLPLMIFIFALFRKKGRKKNEVSVAK